MKSALRRSAAFLAAALVTTAVAQRLSSPLGQSTAVRLTESCSTEESPGKAMVAATPAFRAEMVAAVNDDARDPALARLLWLPAAGSQTQYQSFENQAILDYADPFQNVREIVSAINADATLAARGLSQAYADQYACFSPPPAPGYVRVSEYYSPQLNHYQLAVGDSESGELASSGWLATGESFRALTSGYCYGATNVFRFARAFAERRGSRFLTVDAAECGQVRKNNPAWRPRDVPFFASTPQTGACVGSYSSVAVYRLYNRREMFNDMNHRYTTSTATYAQMQALGWSGEGIAFCAAGT